MGDPAAGADVFANAGCGGCHTLAAAGSDGAVGPNLDELEPPFDEVVEQVTEGGGGMPAFADSLSADEIENVAAYVVQSTSGGAGTATTDDDAATTDDDDGNSGSGGGDDDSG